MENEHRISYKAGITRTPSDFLAPDGELAECVNLTTDHEELKPVVQPSKRFENPINDLHTILYVHQFNDEKRYIMLRAVPHSHDNITTYGYRLHFGAETEPGRIMEYQTPLLSYEASEPDEYKVEAVGKTLIVANGNGLNYFIWDYDTYHDPMYRNIGEIPDPDITFYLLGDQVEPNENYWKTFVKNQDTYGYTVLHRQDTHQVLYYESATNDPAGEHVDDGNDNEKKQSVFNDIVTGLYAKNKKKIASKKGFCRPFFVRYALELQDGTYTHISNPVLMVPAITRNSFCKQDVTHNDLILMTKYCHLYYEMDAKNLEDFGDIVKDVVLFISDGVELYDLNSDQDIYEYVSADEGTKVIFDGIYRTSAAGRSLKRQKMLTNRRTRVDLGNYLVEAMDVLMRRSSKDVLEDLRSTSVFYKLCGIGLADASGNIASKIDTHYLENLTTKDQLPKDDYFSRTKLLPSFLYVYNTRLNLAGVKRGFFEGFDFFFAYDLDSGTATYDFYVRIKTDVGNRWIHHQLPDCQQKFNSHGYFFYPDPRADHVVITSTVAGTTTRVLDAELTEHHGLHGAFYLNAIDGSGQEVGVFNQIASQPTTLPESFDNHDSELLANYVITSDARNPFVFPVEGYNKVGTGKILAIATTVQALSDGKAGDYPLLIFSTSGIWAMSVNKTGLYDSIWNMSREIIVNPKSVTETDEHVFFVSKKGLMVVDGRQVHCVSEAINGLAFDLADLFPLAANTEWNDLVGMAGNADSFQTYITHKDTFLAYDYVDSRIIIHNPWYQFSYVYNMADGSFSKIILPAAMTTAVTDYPDTLMQGVAMEHNSQMDMDMPYTYLYSLYDKPREEDVQSRTLAFLVTRPMKLAGPAGVASLRQLKNVGTWRKGTEQAPLSVVKTDIYISDDLYEWTNDLSRFGGAAKYYRLALFVKMLPTERLSGTILTTQQRRGNNIR